MANTRRQRVRRHFEWVSRLLATTMGAFMDPRESELVLELIVPLRARPLNKIVFVETTIV